MEEGAKLHREFSQSPNMTAEPQLRLAALYEERAQAIRDCINLKPDPRDPYAQMKINMVRQSAHNMALSFSNVVCRIPKDPDITEDREKEDIKAEQKIIDKRFEGCEVIGIETVDEPVTDSLNIYLKTPEGKYITLIIDQVPGEDELYNPLSLKVVNLPDNIEFE